MKLVFLGTKGYIEARSRRHRRHTALLLTHGRRRIMIIYCGSQIVEGDERQLGPRVRRWGQERGVEASIAHDGMELTLG